MAPGSSASRRFWLSIALVLMVWKSPTVHGDEETTTRANIPAYANQICGVFRSPERESLKKLVEMDKRNFNWKGYKRAMEECCTSSGKAVCPVDDFVKKATGYSGAGALNSGSGFMMFGLGFLLIWIPWTLC